MKRFFGIAAGVALLAGGAAAQDESARKMKLELERISTALGPVHAIGGTIKNAPFSGQEIRETNQVLADGTRIHNETKTNVYRDSEGRVRRENGDRVTITDPPAGTTFVLDTKAMTAEKIAAGAVFMRQGPGVASFGVGGGVMAPGQKGSVSVKDGMVTVERDGHAETFPVPENGEWASPDGKTHLFVRKSGEADSASAVSTLRMTDGHIVVTKDMKTETLPIPPDPEMLLLKGQAEMAQKVELAGPGAAGAVLMRHSNGKGEDLGEQMIEGVKARGVRNTSSIEVGKIGNDRPLNTVSESWYSDELKMEVMSRRSDPRAGESTFRLININRSEPPSYLFQVPSGYTERSR